MATPPPPILHPDEALLHPPVYTLSPPTTVPPPTHTQHSFCYASRQHYPHRFFLSLVNAHTCPTTNQRPGRLCTFVTQTLSSVLCWIITKENGVNQTEWRRQSTLGGFDNILSYVEMNESLWKWKKNSSVIKTSLKVKGVEDVLRNMNRISGMEGR